MAVAKATLAGLLMKVMLAKRYSDAPSPLLGDPPRPQCAQPCMQGVSVKLMKVTPDTTIPPLGVMAVSELRTSLPFHGNHSPRLFLPTYFLWKTTGSCSMTSTCTSSFHSRGCPVVATNRLSRMKLLFQSMGVLTRASHVLSYSSMLTNRSNPTLPMTVDVKPTLPFLHRSWSWKGLPPALGWKMSKMRRPYLALECATLPLHSRTGMFHGCTTIGVLMLPPVALRSGRTQKP
mmetsp:Transcript_46201/g.115876  ORF Transcript_46201/g.115876 Transcript_46201/m.115876 type:complete len:233 (+) Transcript_46201:187-885(+)